MPYLNLLCLLRRLVGSGVSVGEGDGENIAVLLPLLGAIVVCRDFPLFFLLPFIFMLAAFDVVELCDAVVVVDMRFDLFAILFRLSMTMSNLPNSGPTTT